MMNQFFNIDLAGKGTTMISKKENIAELVKMTRRLAKIFGSRKMNQRVNDVTAIIVDNI